MSTPGRRRSLGALARKKRSNLRRVANGQKPMVDGREISLSTFQKMGGTTSKAEARRRLQEGRRRDAE